MQLKLTLINLFEKFIYIICFLILIIMILCTLFYLNKDSSVAAITKIVLFLAIIFLTALSAYLAILINRKSKKLFVVAVIAASLLTSFLWNLYAKTAPVSDYKVLLEGASEIAKGVFKESFDKTSYFYIYNFQLGYTAYLACIIKFFGSSLIWLKMLEALYIAGAVILVYMIVGMKKSYDMGAVASMLYATFIFNICGSSIINNQHLGAILMLLGIYLVLKGGKLNIALAGVVFAIMNIIRPLEIIILVAASIFLIYKLVESFKWRKWGIRLVLILLSFYLTTALLNTAFMNIKISPSPLGENHLPYFKLVIGLGAPNGSLFGFQTIDARKTSVYFDLEKLGFDYKKYNNEAVKFINQRIADYKTLTNYIVQKMIFFLGENDNQHYFALNAKQLNRHLSSMGHLQYLLFLLLAAFAIMFNFKSSLQKFIKKYEGTWFNETNSGDKERERDLLNIISVALIGFISVHIFLEVQTRYRYEAYIFIIILAAQSIHYFCSKMEGVFKKKIVKTK